MTRPASSKTKPLPPLKDKGRVPVANGEKLKGKTRGAGPATTVAPASRLAPPTLAMFESTRHDAPTPTETSSGHPDDVLDKFRLDHKKGSTDPTARTPTLAAPASNNLILPATPNYGPSAYFVAPVASLITPSRTGTNAINRLDGADGSRVLSGITLSSSTTPAPLK